MVHGAPPLWPATVRVSMSKHTSSSAHLRSSGQIWKSATHPSPDAFGLWEEAGEPSRTRGGCAHVSCSKADGANLCTARHPLFDQNNNFCSLCLKFTIKLPTNVGWSKVSGSSQQSSRCSSVISSTASVNDVVCLSAGAQGMFSYRKVQVGVCSRSRPVKGGGSLARSTDL